MPISWNEIKDRALHFSKEWANETRENAEAKSFWDDFFNVFGISRRRVATFEEPVKKLNNQYGFIDLFWKGMLLVEHKSKGKNLDKAYSQALDYFSGLNELDLPRYVLVSDFERFRLYDLEDRTEHEFHINDFYQNVRHFSFILGFKKHELKPEDPVNRDAAELMGKLHDLLKESGYTGHSLEVFLVRLLFCLFADDTGIFEKDTFKEYLENRTKPDGTDMGPILANFFQVLDTPKENRQKALDEDLAQFPYVNGNLFAESLRIPSFNTNMRNMLLKACSLDWGKISPAIFGSMFQSVMKAEERRNLGAHYTSETNILKLIKPLFLDELWEEFEKVKTNTRRLQEFHHKLSNLNFLDPACGCGNFLVITYRELRLLELEILRQFFKHGEQVTQIEAVVWIDVDQFNGIEYDEWPSRIAEVAMWLVDHQMNMLIMEEFGQYFARLPLKKSANIIHGNALRINWEDVVPKDKLSYILGNPPFVGKHLMNKEQKEDVKYIFDGTKSYGILDYVSCWFLKSAIYIANTNIKVALVATNSISQGEQVGILWYELLKYNVNITFAYSTFKWKNEAKNNAGVHVVIIGFSEIIAEKKYLFKTIENEEFVQSRVTKINPYLVEAETILIRSRSKPVSPKSPKMAWGNKPVDGGNLLLSEEDKKALIKIEPKAIEYIKPLISAREFLHNKKRYCLWLVGINPNILHSMPEILQRVKNVKIIRENSVDSGARKLALRPSEFRDTKTYKNYILIPAHSSENRIYIPMGFFGEDDIPHNSCQIVENGEPFHFGVLTSLMHMAWIKYTCGRLESRYRYSKDLVYNNYPWPENPTEKQKQRVEEAAQKVLDVRTEFPDSSLADLYDPLTMPPALVKAHQQLDRAVDLCYRPQPFVTEAGRIEFLFELYDKYVNPLIAANEKRIKKQKK